MEYTNAAASPEVRLLSTALATLPTMAVVAAASDLNRDLLIGGEVTQISEWLLLIVILVSGMSIAPAIYECRGRSGLPAEDSWLGSQVCSAVVLAFDALILVSVIGLVGAQYDHMVCLLWIASFWLFCGVLPALKDPPPMPTLQPAVPLNGWPSILHRMIASILLSAISPLEYMPMLPPTQRQTWAWAALLRAAFFFITVVLQNADPSTDEVETVYLVFILFGWMHTVVASLRVLWWPEAIPYHVANVSIVEGNVYAAVA